MGERGVAGEQHFVVALAGALAGQHGQRFLDRWQVVFRQVTGIGTRVGQHLVLFIQRLGQRQCGLGREAEAGVRFALQRGQIEQAGRQAGFRLGFFSHLARLAERRGADGFGAGDFPQAVGAGVFVVVLALEALVEPFAGIAAGLGAEFSLDFPVIPRLEFADLLLALDDDGQRRRLHAADGGQMEATGLRVEGGHCPCAVDADQPVGFRTADGGVGQTFHFAAGAQAGEAVADGPLGHRLQP